VSGEFSAIKNAKFLRTGAIKNYPKKPTSHQLQMGLNHLMANQIQTTRSRQQHGQFNLTGYATGPQAPNVFSPNSN
jgi:hypothetical protein